MKSEASRFEAPLKVASHQLSFFPTDFISEDAKHDQNCALVEAELGKSQLLEAMLAEVQHHRDDNLSLLHSC